MDGGTASFSQHDPAFEFNAPRWYDFQRLNECMPSPTADADAYFSSSQVKGNLAKPKGRVLSQRCLLQRFRCVYRLQ